MDKKFFNVISVPAFLKLFQTFTPICEMQTAGLSSITLPAILANDLYSSENLPHFSRAAMDGYAVFAQDTFGASENNPVYLKVVHRLGVDSIPDFDLKPGQCAQVVTGSALPRGANGVVMIEYTKLITGGEIELIKCIAPGDNIMSQGDDVKKGELVLAKGTKINYRTLGLLAALGIQKVRVLRQLKVGLIITGNELVPFSSKPDIGQIRDVNSLTITHFLQNERCKVRNYGLVRDDKDALATVVQQSISECDLVLISGGSSVGQKDYTLHVLSGFQKSKILAHGVALRPGKPTILAAIGKTPVIGLPGQVSSTLVVLQVLVAPLISFLSGDLNWKKPLKPYLPAQLTANIPSKPGREEVIGVKLLIQDSGLYATPIFAKSGLLKKIAQADGVIYIPAHLEGLTKDEQVQVFPLN